MISTDDLAQHGAFLRATCRALLHDEHGAEDVAQSTFLALLERRAGVADLRAFGARVAQNLARKARRSAGRRAAREERVAREAAPVAGADDGREELLRAVTDAVLALEEPLRSTVLSRYYDGRGTSEIAEREGVPLGTVKSRLARALARLRERLDHEQDGGRKAWSLALAGWLGREAAPAAGPAALLGGVFVSTQSKWILGLVGALVLFLGALRLRDAALPSADQERAAATAPDAALVAGE
ncbi:MAG: RNA polymerase sigma factor, partial [Planctomycetota bacterium]